MVFCCNFFLIGYFSRRSSSASFIIIHTCRARVWNIPKCTGSKLRISRKQLGKNNADQKKNQHSLSIAHWIILCYRAQCSNLISITRAFIIKQRIFSCYSTLFFWHRFLSEYPVKSLQMFEFIWNFVIELH